jgi:hypothetical protein
MEPEYDVPPISAVDKPRNFYFAVLGAFIALSVVVTAWAYIHLALMR